MSEDRIVVYTDGGSRGNPGPGGWAYTIDQAGQRSEGCGAEAYTTNNRMELTAAIMALRQLRAQNPDSIVLHTDSTYLQQGISTWIHNWKRKGWKTSSGSPVKNRDLWMELDELASSMNVDWRWVRGHAGNVDNERCDMLVQEAIVSLQSP